MAETQPGPDASTLTPITADPPPTTVPPPAPSYYYPYGDAYPVPKGVHEGYALPPEYLGVPQAGAVTEDGYAASATQGVREQQLGMVKSSLQIERERQAAEAERIEAETAAFETEQKRYAAAYAQVQAEEGSSSSSTTMLLVVVALCLMFVRS